MPARFSKGTLQFLQLLLLTDTLGLGSVETVQLVLGVAVFKSLAFLLFLASSSPKRRDISNILSPGASALASGRVELIRSVATAWVSSPPPPKVSIAKYISAHSGTKITAGKIYFGCLKLIFFIVIVMFEGFYNLFKLPVPANYAY